MEDVLDQAFRIKDPGFAGIQQDKALLEAAIANRGKKKAHHWVTILLETHVRFVQVSVRIHDTARIDITTE